jgi:hypothetical protein
MVIQQKRRHFAVGVDLGKSAETTAIAVAERQNPPAWDEAEECPPEKAVIEVRHLHRFQPGTLYQDVAKGIYETLKAKELTETKERTAHGTIRDVAIRVDFIVDQTAVATPVADMIVQQIDVPFARRVVLSGSLADTYDDGLYRIPKQALVGGMEVLLETRRLKIAESLASARQLADELVNYRGRKTASVPLTVDTWREQPSDDLVFAVALACWQLQRPQFTYEFI